MNSDAIARCRFFVNVKVKDGGSIRVGLLTADGEPIENYGTANCLPIQTGAVAVPVQWKEASEFVLPDGEQVRLLIELTNAELYAFWIE